MTLILFNYLQFVLNYVFKVPGHVLPLRLGNNFLISFSTLPFSFRNLVRDLVRDLRRLPVSGYTGVSSV